MIPLTTIPSPEEQPKQPLTIEQAFLQILNLNKQENSLLMMLEVEYKIYLERLKRKREHVEAELWIDLYADEKAKPRNETLAKAMIRHNIRMIAIEDQIQKVLEDYQRYVTSLEELKTERHVIYTQLQHLGAYKDEVQPDKIALLSADAQQKHSTRILEIKGRLEKHELSLEQIKKKLNPNPLDTL
jgi:hypothetical protein